MLKKSLTHLLDGAPNVNPPAPAARPPVPPGPAQVVSRHFKLIEFNERRLARGAEAARAEISLDGEWLWMSKMDVRANIREFGPHPELVKARDAYLAHQRPRGSSGT